MNDNGKYLELGLNRVITRFAWTNRLIAPTDFVVGDCVVMGGPDEEGYGTDLIGEILDSILLHR
jgi:hypothetical protein